MGDAGIGQHALDALLPERCDVTENHAGGGDEAKGRGPVSVDAGKPGAEHSEEGGQGRGFGRHGHVGRDGGGRPFIGVRGPHVEGHRRNLEGESHQHHQHPREDQQMAVERRQRQLFIQQQQIGGRSASSGEQEGNAVEQDATGKGSQQEVLDACFDAPFLSTQIGHQDVDAQRHEFQGEVDAHEIRGSHQELHATQGKKDQGIILDGLLLQSAQLGLAQHHGDESRRSAKQLETPCEAIHLEHVGEPGTVGCGGLQDPCHREDG